MLRKITCGVLLLLGLQFCTTDVTENHLYASNIINPNASYEIYKTENFFHLLKLNTRNGCITQIQIGVGDTLPSEDSINATPLVPIEEQQNGRFALYPTGNIYNFVLLDQISGKIWQVQWHTDPKSRTIQAIE